MRVPGTTSSTMKSCRTLATFRFPTDTRSSPDMRSFRGLGCAGELSRGESELVHEMPLTVYGTKGWDKWRLTRTQTAKRRSGAERGCGGGCDRFLAAGPAHSLVRLHHSR